MNAAIIIMACTRPRAQAWSDNVDNGRGVHAPAALRKAVRVGARRVGAGRLLPRRPLLAAVADRAAAAAAVHRALVIEDHVLSKVHYY